MLEVKYNSTQYYHDQLINFQNYLHIHLRNIDHNICPVDIGKETFDFIF